MPAFMVKIFSFAVGQRRIRGEGAPVAPIPPGLPRLNGLGHWRDDDGRERRSARPMSVKPTGRYRPCPTSTRASATLAPRSTNDLVELVRARTQPTVLIVGSRTGRIVRRLRASSPWRQAARRGAQARAASRGSRDRSPAGGAGDRSTGRGLIEPFLRAGVRIRHIQLLGPGLREIASEHFADTGCAYEFQCSLPQWRTEAILREHLESLGLEVEFGTEVTSIEDDPDGLRVMLDTGGRTETVTAAYVLGAGGGHSVTRHSMQEHLEGETYDGRYIRRRRESSPCLPARMRPSSL